nr:peptidase C48, SUMO/sentrin/Ubl1 [Tanacetum cinerariifolium]
ANNNKEEGMENTKAKNQQIVGEVQKDERNENQNIAECSEKKMNKKRGLPKTMKLITIRKKGCAEKKKDQTDDVNWDYFLKNEEEIIRKGREFSAEIRKKAQQQERERKRKGKREKHQTGSSSQESPVFGIDNSLQGSQPTFGLSASPTYEKIKIISEKKKKMEVNSKYVNKTVDPAVELTEDEKVLGRSIFGTQEEEEEEVFNDDERMILFRMNIQSLAPGLEIDTSVIDEYVSILNHEEKFKMKNMKRHFFYTSMMMENDVKMQMEDVELSFFPIIAHGHYYLIVFNLKTWKAVIIDNSESDATYDGKYKDNVEFV